MRPIEFVVALPLLASSLDAQPRITIGGIVNAASYGSLRTPDAGLAQGAMIVIFGEGLGPATLVGAPSLPLQTELSGTRVRIGSHDAYLLYTSARQVAAIVPSVVSIGTTEVAVVYNSQTSQPRPANVVAADFGIFTRNSAGYGPAIAQNVITGSEVIPNELTRAAAPRDTVTLYGTGLGAIDTADNIAPGIKPAAVPVQVIVAGRMVQPTYAGRSANFPGLDQINFVLPADVLAGCYVPVLVRAGNRVSNAAAIAISSNGSRMCEHPLGLSESALRRLDAGQTITLGLLKLAKFVYMGVLFEDEATAVLGEVDAGGVFIQSTVSVREVPLPFSSSVLPLAKSGDCVVMTLEAGEVTTVPLIPANPMVRGLDAGVSVMLSGPGGKMAALQKRAGEAAYRSSLASAFAENSMNFLEPGSWEIAGPGGADIPAFTATVALPELISVHAPLTVSRRAPFNVNWSGGAATDELLLVGTSRTGLGLFQGSIGAFACTAIPGTRTFSVPATILSQVPSGFGILTVVSSGRGPAPSIAVNGGRQIDFTAFTYSYSNSVVIGFQ